MILLFLIFLNSYAYSNDVDDLISKRIQHCNALRNEIDEPGQFSGVYPPSPEKLVEQIRTNFSRDYEKYMSKYIDMDCGAGVSSILKWESNFIQKRLNQKKILGCETQRVMECIEGRIEQRQKFISQKNLAIDTPFLISPKGRRYPNSKCKIIPRKLR